ncbi:hypothetical protein EMPS_07227 [Entomortierella parvispora]|uniref:Uncharacterized protein n=1 Tax=Entomortierella parvispora TaxID=205924 RepID=A0A9P3HDT5_9FUNG|nr:hypothetical protein EMPS_07227 [Entomortierella parvispora]
MKPHSRFACVSPGSGLRSALVVVYGCFLESFSRNAYRCLSTPCWLFQSSCCMCHYMSSPSRSFDEVDLPTFEEPLLLLRGLGVQRLNPKPAHMGLEFLA